MEISLKKGIFDINEYSLVIIDECHNLQYTKVIENYKHRLLGFTATPITMKKYNFFKCNNCNTIDDNSFDCCNKEAKKYIKKVSLAEFYGSLIMGVNIEYLIENNYLTKDYCFISDSDKLDLLKVDSSGEFSKQSQDEVFNNVASNENLLANYLEHSKGLKTMIFNSNIKQNAEAYKLFKANGINVLSYDSKTKENRKDIVDLFKQSKDIVLMSVGVFTTGFDDETVESIILNKATKSLSLYHQMVGRGGRITKKILKPYFKLIDLGGNISRFGRWSVSVDWNTLYSDESIRRANKKDTDEFIICYKCFIFSIIITT